MKRIIIFTLLFVLVFFTVSCEDASKPGTNKATEYTTTVETKTDPNTEQEIAFEFPVPMYDDWDEFLTTWSQAVRDHSSGTASVNGVNAKISLTIPVLKSSEFKFYQVLIREHSYAYYYVPVDYEKGYFSYNLGIFVSIANGNGTFAAVMDQFELTPVNGIAYDESRNTWYIDKDGRCLDIAFPKSIPVTTEEELYSYFEFEEYTVSGNSGEVQ